MTEPEGRALLIKKLLNKAEAAGTTEAEREAFTAKALKLMLQWGIEDAMLTDADRLAEERIVRREFATDVPKAYSFEYACIGVQVATALGCRGILHARYADGRGKRTNLLIIGFESDVQRAGQLFQSLVLQCTLALGVYAKRIPPYLSGTDKYNSKRSFISGFASGVKEKFAAMNREVMAEAAPGTDLVLVDRGAKVDNWIGDNMRLGNARPRLYHENAHNVGSVAGQRADLGGSKLGGDRRGIEG